MIDQKSIISNYLGVELSPSTVLNRVYRHIHDITDILRKLVFGETDYITLPTINLVKQFDH